MNLLPVSSSEPGSLNSSPSKGVKRSLSDSSDLKDLFTSPHEKRQKTPCHSPERGPTSSISPLAQKVLRLNFDHSFNLAPSIHLTRTILDEEEILQPVRADFENLPYLMSTIDEEEAQAEKIRNIIENPASFFSKIETLLNDENFSINKSLNLLNDYYAVLLEIQDTSLNESHFLDPAFILTLCQLHFRVQIHLTDSGSIYVENVDENFQKYLTMACSLLDFSKNQAKDLQKLLVTEKLSNDPAYAILKQILSEKKYLSLNDGQLILLSEQRILHHVLERTKDSETGVEDTDKKVHQLALHLLGLVNHGQHVGVYSLFHAVKNTQNIGSILQSKILVKHEQKYLGAFVSTRHERGIGDCAVVVSSQTVAAKKLSRIERRSEEEGDGIWIGSEEPLTPDKLRVIHQPLTPNTHSTLKKSLPEGCILVESAVQDRFNEYARELSDIIPIPPGTQFSDIAPWHESREKTEDVNANPFA